jgi:hypothetical protein
MFGNPRWICWAALAALAWTMPAMAQSLGTGFTYQGFLKQNGTPANGSFTMTFQLFDAASGGNSVAGPINPTPSPVPVTNGQFTVQLDFGAAAYTGNKRWLAITVNGTTLAPRQELSATPSPWWPRAARNDPAYRSLSVFCRS